MKDERELKRLTVIFLILLSVACEKDGSPVKPIYSDFKETEHIISKMGDTMRLTIKVPDATYFSLSADTNEITPEDSNCFIVPSDEMNWLAQNLSDTTVFHWEFMTAVTPYPIEDCVLFAFLDNPEEYMCSIGSGKNAGITMQKLIKPLSGDVRFVLDNAANSLMGE